MIGGKKGKRGQIKVGMECNAKGKGTSRSTASNRPDRNGYTGAGPRARPFRLPDGHPLVALMQHPNLRKSFGNLHNTMKYNN